MLCCGQVWPLGFATDFANRLTLACKQTCTIRNRLSPLFTGCGQRFLAVDSLCPNPEWNRDGIGTYVVSNFVP
jgi:hypothetical protein